MTTVMARVEVLVIRDPDGPAVVRVFIDGREHADVTEYSVDAGAGWDRTDWDTHRDELLAAATPGPVTDALIAAFADPPGVEYVHTPTTEGN